MRDARGPHSGDAKRETVLQSLGLCDWMDVGTEGERESGKTCSFPAWAIGWWVTVPFVKTEHTESPPLTSRLGLFLPVSGWFQSDRDLQSPSREAASASLFSILPLRE